MHTTSYSKLACFSSTHTHTHIHYLFQSFRNAPSCCGFAKIDVFWQLTTPQALSLHPSCLSSREAGVSSFQHPVSHTPFFPAQLDFVAKPSPGSSLITSKNPETPTANPLSYSECIHLCSLPRSVFIRNLTLRFLVLCCPPPRLLPTGSLTVAKL